jgi:hypothetical protein
MIVFVEERWLRTTRKAGTKYDEGGARRQFVACSPAELPVNNVQTGSYRESLA